MRARLDGDLLAHMLSFVRTTTFMAARPVCRAWRDARPAWTELALPSTREHSDKVCAVSRPNLVQVLDLRQYHFGEFDWDWLDRFSQLTLVRIGQSLAAYSALERHLRASELRAGRAVLTIKVDARVQHAPAPTHDLHVDPGRVERLLLLTAGFAPVNLHQCAQY
jgi:hypothetical protein